MACGKMIKKFIFPLALLFVFALFINVAGAIVNSVNLISPPNATWTNKTNETLQFIFHYQGNTTNASCTLYLDAQPVATNSTTLNNTNTTLYSNTSFGEGTHTWNVTCVDTDGQSGSSPTFEFYADWTEPVIILISPANNTWTNQSKPQFIFNVTDNLAPTLTCTLRVYRDEISIINQTNSSVYSSSITTIQNDTSLPDTNYFANQNFYFWHIECIDLAANLNSTFNVYDDFRLFVDNTTPKFVGTNFSIRINPSNISIYDPVIFTLQFNETNVKYVGLDVVDLNECVVKIYKKPVTVFFGDPSQEVKEYWGNWNSEIFVLSNGTHNTTNVTVKMNEYENGYYLVSGWLNESFKVYAYFSTSSPYSLISINLTDGSQGWFASQLAGNFTSTFMNSTYNDVNDTLIFTNLSNLRLIKTLANESHLFAANAHVEDKALNSKWTKPVGLEKTGLKVVTTPPSGIFVSGKIYDLDTGQLLTGVNVTVVVTEFKPGGPVPDVLRGLTWSNSKTVSSGCS